MATATGEGYNNGDVDDSGDDNSMTMVTGRATAMAMPVTATGMATLMVTAMALASESLTLMSM